MKHKVYLPAFVRARSLASLVAAVLTLVSTVNTARAKSTSNSEVDQLNHPCNDACQTAADYVTTFYPLWFTYEQSKGSTPNQLVGPATVTPLYQVVVAINVDTLYTGSFMQLSASNPAILTIPSTNVVYSVLVVDPYGNVFNFKTKFPAGLYAFEGPQGYDNSQGPLPKGATMIEVPVDHPTIVFRADKYSSNGQDQTSEADTFRRSLKLQSLSDYLLPDPPPSETVIEPETNYAFPLKTVADTEIAKIPLLFLAQLKAAVASPRTPPLTPDEAALSDHFNALFERRVSLLDLTDGAQAAHRNIIRNYRTHRDPNGWVDFTNIGHWENNVLDRAGITEFLQYGNDFSSAAYFHVFVDAEGKALDGANGRTYTIHFPPGQPPAAQRFWSITAYTPHAIELVPNRLQKYDVASYTPGLTYNSDKSLTLYFGTTKPDGVPAANYLPVPPRKFNLMLRFYGPQGVVEDGAYVPPPVTEQSGY